MVGTTTAGLNINMSPELRKRGGITEIRVIGLILQSFNPYTDTSFNSLVSYLTYAKVMDDAL